MYFAVNLDGSSKEGALGSGAVGIAASLINALIANREL